MRTNVEIDIPLREPGAATNPTDAEAFRKSIAESTAIANADPDATRESYGQFVKVPAPALANIKFNFFDPAVRPDGLQPWIESRAGKEPCGLKSTPRSFSRTGC